MANPNLQISDNGSATPEPHRCRSLDETIEQCLGDFNRVQLFQAVILSLAWFFDAQQLFITVFTDAQPPWKCNGGHASCNATAELCRLPRDSWSWESAAFRSVVSEWSLECASSVVRGLPASSFFVGSLAGGFAVATLADSALGRRNLLVLSCLSMSLTGVVTAFSKNIWMYAGLKLVLGFGRSSILTCALVLATESVGKKWRSNVGAIGFISFMLGFLSLPVMAFLLRGRSWRFLYLYTCLPCFPYSILVHFSVHESPRWLFLKGRNQEFTTTVTRLAAAAPSEDSSSLWHFVEQSEKPQEQSLYSAMKLLIGRRWSFLRLLCMMVVTFGIGMGYVGMPLGLGNLSFNLYLSVVVNALAEFPASVVTVILIRKVNRKKCVVGFTMLSGICGMACVAAAGRKVLQITLEAIAFFCACTAIDVEMIYCLELFPTCVRNSAVAMSRQALILSGIISPVLVAAGRRNEWLSYGVFGATILLCGLVVLWLPETKGRPLSDTMEDEESKPDFN